MLALPGLQTTPDYFSSPVFQTQYLAVGFCAGGLSDVAGSLGTYGNSVIMMSGSRKMSRYPTGVLL